MGTNEKRLWGCFCSLTTCQLTFRAGKLSEVHLDSRWTASDSLADNHGQSQKQFDSEILLVGWRYYIQFSPAEPITRPGSWYQTSTISRLEQNASHGSLLSHVDEDLRRETSIRWWPYSLMHLLKILTYIMLSVWKASENLLSKPECHRFD